MLKKKIKPTTLAKDVLKYLSPKTRGKVRLYPMSGRGFVNFLDKPPLATEWWPSHDYKMEAKTDVQKAVKAGKPCQVCGIGALLVAKAIRVDAVRTEGDNLSCPAYAVGRDRVVKGLKGIFSRDQLALIEDAFECWIGLPPRFEEASATARLRAICKNIIKNRGEFVPTERAEEEEYDRPD